MPIAAAVGLGISGASALLGGLFGSRAAKKAAAAQVAATGEARAEYKRAGSSGRAELDREYNQTREDYRPYTSAGENAVTRIEDLTAPGGYLNQDYKTFDETFNRDEFKFNEPESEKFKFGKDDFEKDPGYQFRLDEGQKALERSAAAKGRVLGGATMKAVARYGSNYASDEFQKAYDRAKGTYGVNTAEYDKRYGRAEGTYKTNYDVGRDIFNSKFDTYKANEATFEREHKDRYGYLSDLAGSGLTATTARAGFAERHGQDVAGSYEREGAAVGDTFIQAGNAKASGIIGSANAWSGTLGQLGKLGTGVASGAFGSWSKAPVTSGGGRYG